MKVTTAQQTWLDDWAHGDSIVGTPTRDGTDVVVALETGTVRVAPDGTVTEEAADASSVRYAVELIVEVHDGKTRAGTPLGSAGEVRERIAAQLSFGGIVAVVDRCEQIKPSDVPWTESPPEGAYGEAYYGLLSGLYYLREVGKEEPGINVDLEGEGPATAAGSCS